MAKKKPTTDVWLFAVWECSVCLQTVKSPASVTKGDTLMCESCGAEHKCGDVCSD